MEAQFRQHFIDQWTKYFGATDLPIAYYYTDTPRPEEFSTSRNEARCLIGNLKQVRQGSPFVYDA